MITTPVTTSTTPTNGMSNGGHIDQKRVHAGGNSIELAEENLNKDVMKKEKEMNQGI